MVRCRLFIMRLNYQTTLKDMMWLQNYVDRLEAGASPAIYYLLLAVSTIGIWLLSHSPGFSQKPAFSGILLILMLMMVVGLSGLPHSPVAGWFWVWRRTRRWPALLGMRSLWLNQERCVEGTPEAIKRLISFGEDEEPLLSDEIQELIHRHVPIVISWSNVTHFGEDKHGIYILSDKSGAGIIIPKSSLSDPERVQQVYEVISNMWATVRYGGTATNVDKVWPPPPQTLKS